MKELRKVLDKREGGGRQERAPVEGKNRRAVDWYIDACIHVSVKKLSVKLVAGKAKDISDELQVAPLSPSSPFSSLSPVSPKLSYFEISSSDFHFIFHNSVEAHPAVGIQVSLGSLQVQEYLSLKACKEFRTILKAPAGVAREGEGGEEGKEKDCSKGGVQFPGLGSGWKPFCKAKDKKPEKTPHHPALYFRHETLGYDCSLEGRAARPSSDPDARFFLFSSGGMEAICSVEGLYSCISAIFASVSPSNLTELIASADQSIQNAIFGARHALQEWLDEASRVGGKSMRVEVGASLSPLKVICPADISNAATSRKLVVDLGRGRVKSIMGEGGVDVDVVNVSVLNIHAQWEDPLIENRKVYSILEKTSLECQLSLRHTPHPRLPSIEGDIGLKKAPPPLGPSGLSTSTVSKNQCSWAVDKFLIEFIVAQISAIQDCFAVSGGGELDGEGEGEGEDVDEEELPILEPLVTPRGPRSIGGGRRSPQTSETSETSEEGRGRRCASQGWTFRKPEKPSATLMVLSIETAPLRVSWMHMEKHQPLWSVELGKGKGKYTVSSSGGELEATLGSLFILSSEAKHLLYHPDPCSLLLRGDPSQLILALSPGAKFTLPLSGLGDLVMAVLSLDLPFPEDRDTPLQQMMSYRVEAQACQFLLPDETTGDTLLLQGDVKVSFNIMADKNGIVLRNDLFISADALCLGWEHQPPFLGPTRLRIGNSTEMASLSVSWDIFLEPTDLRIELASEMSKFFSFGVLLGNWVNFIMETSWLLKREGGIQGMPFGPISMRLRTDGLRILAVGQAGERRGEKGAALSILLEDCNMSFLTEGFLGGQTPPPPYLDGQLALSVDLLLPSLGKVATIEPFRLGAKNGKVFSSWINLNILPQMGDSLRQLAVAMGQGVSRGYRKVLSCVEEGGQEGRAESVPLPDVRFMATSVLQKAWLDLPPPLKELPGFTAVHAGLDVAEEGDLSSLQQLRHMNQVKKGDTRGGTGGIRRVSTSKDRDRALRCEESGVKAQRVVNRLGQAVFIRLSVVLSTCAFTVCESVMHSRGRGEMESSVGGFSTRQTVPGDSGTVRWRASSFGSGFDIDGRAEEEAEDSSNFWVGLRDGEMVNVPPGSLASSLLIRVEIEGKCFELMFYPPLAGRQEGSGTAYSEKRKIKLPNQKKVLVVLRQVWNQEERRWDLSLSSALEVVSRNMHNACKDLQVAPSAEDEDHHPSKNLIPKRHAHREEDCAPEFPCGSNFLNLKSVGNEKVSSFPIPLWWLSSSTSSIRMRSLDGLLFGSSLTLLTGPPLSLLASGKEAHLSGSLNLDLDERTHIACHVLPPSDEGISRLKIEPVFKLHNLLCESLTILPLSVGGEGGRRRSSAGSVLSGSSGTELLSEMAVEAGEKVHIPLRLEEFCIEISVASLGISFFSAPLAPNWVKPIRRSSSHSGSGERKTTETKQIKFIPKTPIPNIDPFTVCCEISSIRCASSRVGEEKVASISLVLWAPCWVVNRRADCSLFVGWKVLAGRGEEGNTNPGYGLTKKLERNTRRMLSAHLPRKVRVGLAASKDADLSVPISTSKIGEGTVVIPAIPRLWLAYSVTPAAPPFERTMVLSLYRRLTLVNACNCSVWIAVALSQTQKKTKNATFSKARQRPYRLLPHQTLEFDPDVVGEDWKKKNVRLQLTRVDPFDETIPLSVRELSWSGVFEVIKNDKDVGGPTRFQLRHRGNHEDSFHITSVELLRQSPLPATFIRISEPSTPLFRIRNATSGFPIEVAQVGKRRETLGVCGQGETLGWAWHGGGEGKGGKMEKPLTIAVLKDFSTSSRESREVLGEIHASTALSTGPQLINLGAPRQHGEIFAVESRVLGGVRTIVVYPPITICNRSNFNLDIKFNSLVFKLESFREIVTDRQKPVQGNELSFCLSKGKPGKGYHKGRPGGGEDWVGQISTVGRGDEDKEIVIRCQDPAFPEDYVFVEVQLKSFPLLQAHQIMISSLGRDQAHWKLENYLSRTLLVCEPGTEPTRLASSLLIPPSSAAPWGWRTERSPARILVCVQEKGWLGGDIRVQMFVDWPMYSVDLEKKSVLPLNNRARQHSKPPFSFHVYSSEEGVMVIHLADPSARLRGTMGAATPLARSRSPIAKMKRDEGSKAHQMMDQLEGGISQISEEASKLLGRTAGKLEHLKGFLGGASAFKRVAGSTSMIPSASFLGDRGRSLDFQTMLSKTAALEGVHLDAKREKAAEKKEKVTGVFLSGVGVSVCDASFGEVAYISLSGVAVSRVELGHTAHIQARVEDFQVDSHDPLRTFAQLIHSQEAGLHRPFLTAKIVESLSSDDSLSSLAAFHVVSVQFVDTLVVNVDQETLKNLISVLDDLVQNVGAETGEAAVDGRSYLIGYANMVRQTQVPDPEDFPLAWKQLLSEGVDLEELTTASRSQAKPLYIEKLRIQSNLAERQKVGSLRVILSVSSVISPAIKAQVLADPRHKAYRYMVADLSLTSADGEKRSKEALVLNRRVEQVLTALGLVNVNKFPLKLKGVDRTLAFFSSPSDLTQELGAKYLYEILASLHLLIGSTDLIGNPVNLLSCFSRASQWLTHNMSGEVASAVNHRVELAEEEGRQGLGSSSASPRGRRVVSVPANLLTRLVVDECFQVLNVTQNVTAVFTVGWWAALESISGFFLVIYRFLDHISTRCIDIESAKRADDIVRGTLIGLFMAFFVHIPSICRFWIFEPAEAVRRRGWKSLFPTLLGGLALTVLGLLAAVFCIIWNILDGTKRMISWQELLDPAPPPSIRPTRRCALGKQGKPFDFNFASAASALGKIPGGGRRRLTMSVPILASRDPEKDPFLPSYFCSSVSSDPGGKNDRESLVLLSDCYLMWPRKDLIGSNAKIHRIKGKKGGRRGKPDFYQIIVFFRVRNGAERGRKANEDLIRMVDRPENDTARGEVVKAPSAWKSMGLKERGGAEESVFVESFFYVKTFEDVCKIFEVAGKFFNTYETK